VAEREDGVSCATCNATLVPRWDAALVCPDCNATGFAAATPPAVHPTAIAKVARFEAYALERGWTLGELWNTDGWHCARGLVCYVRPEHRVRECTERAIVLVHTDVLGREIVTTFRRSVHAARVPVERLHVRPMREAA
jgi:hypothetical protein